MSVIFSSTLLLGTLGFVSAVVLYFIARKFYVPEDPHIEEVESLLPGANCGGCGFNGCHDFAVACCKADSLVSMNCPGAGSEVMSKISSIVGLASSQSVRKIAVLKCNGSPDRRTPVADYEGIVSCSFLHSISGGTFTCTYGCLGEGDCVATCRWNAITINPETRLPVVDESRCTGCGACADKCPNKLIEIRPAGRRDLKVWVACSNCDKAKDALAACKSACIACGKCKRACQFDAIEITGNHARIDYEKCKLCRKCVDVCPTGAILFSGPFVKTPISAE